MTTPNDNQNGKDITKPAKISFWVLLFGCTIVLMILKEMNVWEFGKLHYWHTFIPIMFPFAIGGAFIIIYILWSGIKDFYWFWFKDPNNYRKRK